MNVYLWNSFFGGSLLALCVVAFSAFYGRVVGISGIVNNAVFKWQTWQLGFMTGMLAIGFFQPQVILDQDVSIMAATGFLVGFGVTMGNGCTSGHGLCGLARLSKRSMVSVFIFMGVAMITRLFINDLQYNSIEYQDGLLISENNQVLLVIALIGSIIGFYYSKKLPMGLVSVFAGMVFALGLSIGGMIYPEKVFGFLNLSLALGDFQLMPFIDPSLGVVFASGLLPNLIMHPVITKSLVAPLSGVKWHFPHKNTIDFRLVFGAVLFGVGWGAGGLCPGPGVVLLPQVIMYGNTSVLGWWVGLLSGMYFVMKLLKA